MRNLIDSIVAFISPKAGYERRIWREELKQRSYDAGNYGGSNTNWRTLQGSAEMQDKYSRDIVRERARDLERNSDFAQSIIGAFRRNVIGKGLTLQAKTDDEEINKQIEELWKEWGKKRNCDATETQSLNQLLRMVIERKKVDGGILIKKCFTSGGELPFKLQIIEVDELDKTATKAKGENNRVVGGIEYNKYNKAVGYYIRQYTVDGITIENPVYVDAKDIIFIFSKKRPSQIREMSDLAPTITRIRDINEYMTAVSVKERIGACLAVFIKRINPKTGEMAGRNNVQSEKRKHYQGKTISPGMIQELNAGDEIQTVNPSGQATDAAQYIKAQQRIMAAGQGLSYEASSRDMSQSNYSSARAGAIEDEMTYEEDKELIEQVLDEIYETFIISAVLAQKITVKDFWENKSKYMRHEWIRKPKKWVDPLKEANAQKIALQTGQKTFQQIAAENGMDWKEQVDSIAEVLEYAREKKIDLGGVLYGKGNETMYLQGRNKQ